METQNVTRAETGVRANDWNLSVMVQKLEAEQALEPALVPIKVGCEFLAVSPAEMYRLLGRGDVEGVKAGKRTLLRFQSLKIRAASLPPAKIKPPTRRTHKDA
jgi:hypothetical protein